MYLLFTLPVKVLRPLKCSGLTIMLRKLIKTPSCLKENVQLKCYEIVYPEIVTSSWYLIKSIRNINWMHLNFYIPYSQFFQISTVRSN